MAKKMTEQQRKFADEYLKCGVAEKAALSAGYSKSYARVRSHKLLAIVSIKNYIEKAQSEMRTNAIADGQQVLEFLTRVMKGEEKEREFLINNDESMVKEKDPQMRDRLKSAELLGKHLSLFTEKQETAAPVIVNIDASGMFKSNEEDET